MNHKITKITVLLSAAIALSPVTHAATGDVFRARLFLRGAYQDTNEVNQVLRIGRVPLNNAALINLARGRAITNDVPDNEILALLRDRNDHDRHLIVFDKNTQSNLVTIAEIETEGRVRKPGQAVFIWDLDFDESGNTTNGLIDGDFKVAGTRVRTNSTFVSTGKLIGTLDLNSEGESFHIIVPDGAISVRGPALGEVITDDDN